MPLIDKMLLLPLFIHMALMVFLSFKMYRARVGAFKKGQVNIPEIALDKSKWPDDVKQKQNSMHNQFEFPPFFYAAVILALVVGVQSWEFVILAWIFSLSRIAHAMIHISSNYLPHRMKAFGIGFLMLILMWLYLFVHIFIFI